MENTNLFKRPIQYLDKYTFPIPFALQEMDCYVYNI